MKIICKYLIFLAVLILVVSCTDQDTAFDKLEKINQDPLHYLTDNKVVLTKIQQEKLTKDFFDHYFSVWRNQGTWYSTQQVLTNIKNDFVEHSKTSEWDETGNKIHKEFIKKLQDTANLNQYPNINQPGIIIQSTNVRVLPTRLPSYEDPKKAGGGYPFDSLQSSFIDAGTPVRILHQTLDGWVLINTPSYYGWVTSEAVAQVKPEFIKQWMESSYLVGKKEGYPFFDDAHHIATTTRIGVIYPIFGETKDYYKTAFPIINQQGFAENRILSIEKDKVTRFPIEISQQAIARVAENLMGDLYDWGGQYELRDCSATMEDIFANFAIWLPRSASQQASVGTHFSFANLTPEQKTNLIKSKGKPGLTLINFPGHVALYIGYENGKIYILHEMWGLHTRNIFNKEGRLIIGRTVIVPMDFGKYFSNVKKTWLDTASGMTLLT